MQRLGALAAAGLTPDDLAAARDEFARAGCVCEVADLAVAAGVQDLVGAAGAEVLIVRAAAVAWALLGGRAGPDALEAEHAALKPDKVALMRGAVKDKRARWNLCFADNAQEPTYEAGHGTVVSFGAVPHTGASASATRPRCYSVRKRAACWPRATTTTWPSCNPTDSGLRVH
jgi:hypothetical protein